MRKLRAIVFDDEEFIVDLFARYFGAMDYEVMTYTEPLICPIYEKNAEACTNEHPCADIIITDFRMPRMNGLEVIASQAARGCKLTARNKAVVSGYLDDESQVKIKQLGCRIFTKPIDFAELSDWVAECEKRIDRSRPLGPIRLRVT